MTQSAIAKSMTHGEAGLCCVFSLSAFLCLFAQANALDTAFAFHAVLFSAASLAAVFAIVNRYFERRRCRRRRSTAGPNYNMGPIKFSVVDAMFWGIAGFAVGLIIACAARLAGAQFRSALDQLRPVAAAAHLGGDLRLRRQCADRDLVLCRAEDLPRPPRRRSRALVRRARLQLLHRDRRHRLSARRHAVQGICRAGVVRRSLADDRLGHLSAGLPGDADQAQGAAHLRRQLVLSRLHRHHRRAASRQQSRRCRCRCSARNPTSPGAACRMPCSSGGTATTRSASS